MSSRLVQPRCIALALGALFSARGASAQSTALPLQSASAGPAEPAELFRHARADAGAGRFAEAVEERKRVAAAKETAAVRFEIARCEEALGKTGAALADFELAQREGEQAPKAEEVAKRAGDRATALRPRVPRLIVVAPRLSPDDMAVSLDGQDLAPAALGVALRLDPGEHHVEAMAPARPTFHADLDLAAGDARTVQIVFPGPETPSAGEKLVVASTNLASSTQRTWGWITIAAGGALAAGSGLFLALRNNALQNAANECPAKSCTVDQANQASSTESSARTDEAVAIVLVSAAALAVGGGVALLVTAPKSAGTVAVAPGAAGAPAGVSLRGSF
jgi:hypothetical protein